MVTVKAILFTGQEQCVWGYGCVWLWLGEETWMWCVCVCVGRGVHPESGLEFSLGLRAGDGAQEDQNQQEPVVRISSCFQVQ